MISVIVPIYNVQDQISRCVESIISQTYSNIEIILVDDGSTDDSGIRCDAYAKMDSRIRVIHQNNKGVSAARNCGIEEAVGEWMVFVDGDDYVEPRFIERLFHEAVMIDADIVMCNYILRTEDGTVIENQNYSVVPGKKAFGNLEALLLFENRKYGTFFDVVWNKIYRKELFEAIRFPEGVSLVEDISVLPEIYYNANRLAILDDKLYNYVIRANSISRSTYSLKEDYQIRWPILEQRLKSYVLWDVKELVLLHLIHMYSYTEHFNPNESMMMRKIQKNFRQMYRNGHYKTRISVKQKVKFLLAVISLKLYNNIVKVKINSGK